MRNVTKYSLLLICLSNFLANAENPYYGFYVSEKGMLYKLFRHNIFNFEIDLPQNWIFGIAGKSPGQVVMMYPEGLSAASFSPNYETISVGILPISNLTLNKAYEYTLLGMQKGHKGLNIVQQKTKHTLNGNAAIHFIYNWPSKIGYSITERVYLVEAYSRIYSITTRTIDPVGKEMADIHNGIINTFSPIPAVEFK